MDGSPQGNLTYMFKFIPKSKISQLSNNSGVYAFKKGAKLFYIGKAANIKERIKNHFAQPAYRDNLFINRVSKIGYIKTNSEIKALILEANLIKKYQPKYNVIWRDDKNYFFVAKTIEDFPRIFWTHQTKLPKVQSLKFKVNYIGPFVDGKALKETLKVLRKVFPYRSCRVIPNRPCLWYHLNRCPAPCLLKSKIIKEIPPDGARPKAGRVAGGLSSLKIKKLSQKNARNLMKIIKEGKNPVLRELKKEMEEASKNRDFEEAGKIRDQINALERVISHAKIFEPQLPQKTNWLKTQEVLQRILKTRNKISRIEAYDVSNIVGQEATGSMVTFINGLPNKNFYRKFKIKIAGKPNDIAMIKEVLTRRFKHREWPYPDLILIDGGRAQLNAAIKTLKSLTYRPKPKIVALAKKRSIAKPRTKLCFGAGENKLFVENQRNPILLKKLPREISNLILQLRDEAHRFARKYHIKLRELELFSKL